jgi:TusA-related sulfurtransferase
MDNKVKPKVSVDNTDHGIVNDPSSSKDGYIAFDFSGTLAKHKKQTTDKFQPGEPVPNMIAIAKGFLAKGYKIKILTVHAKHPEAVKTIQDWCVKNLGQKVDEVTNIKKKGMIQFWDDRAIRVVRDQGLPAHEIDTAMKDLTMDKKNI